MKSENESINEIEKLNAIGMKIMAGLVVVIVVLVVVGSSRVQWYWQQSLIIGHTSANLSLAILQLITVLHMLLKELLE